ncbi:hypothetical protein [Deinococcus altitudinis]|uniref:hypothetical protein n=1 Tax=Deinococcus altitudinis TaxID=468914 RepID=UPI00389263DD
MKRVLLNVLRGAYPDGFSLLYARVIVALCHLGFAGVCLIRPNLEMLFKAYRPFGDIELWGYGLGVLSVLLLVSRRGSLWLMLLQFISAVTLFTIAQLLTSGVGLLPTAGSITVLGVISLLLVGKTFQYWLPTSRHYARLMQHPPGWARRMFPELERGRRG